VSLQRIVVVGTTGSGKTTLARNLASRLGLPHVELDALNWGPDWTERPVEEFQADLDRATAGPAWVADGNYRRAGNLHWARADTVVWLDYPLGLILWRLWWRTWGRWLRREELWSGNRERMTTHLFSRDSLFLWALQTYRRRRREYGALFRGEELAHLRRIHLRSAHEAERWLASLSSPETAG
jgi:adenylate kinase family enzyme